ncbi:MAG: RHS repeat-associated core domain-containing protein [Treponema sp.]|nr:RHS repeat-associated core domain-containing protein [Treponema sp.]
MKKISRYFLLFLFSLFVFSPLCLFADDDLDGNDDGNTDYGYGWQGDDNDDSDTPEDTDDNSESDCPSISDMNSWSDDDWSSFLDSCQEVPDGYDGTPNTAGQEANDWHSGAASGDAYDFGSNTTVTTASGEIISVGINDVLQDDGSISFTYTGPGCEDPDFKAEVEARVEAFFADQETRHTAEALYEAITNLMAAKAELEAAKSAKEEPAKIAELEAKVNEAKSVLEELCAQNGYIYSVTGRGNYGAIIDKEGKAVMKVGDPVIFATGDFVIDDIDSCRCGNKTAFEIQRHYSSENAAIEDISSGIFGRGWSSNLETRIVRGYSTDFEEAVPGWENCISELEEHEKTISEYLSDDTECSNIYASMQELLESAKAEYAEIKNCAEKSVAQRYDNRYVEYGLPAKYAPKIGMDSVLFVQDNGGMIVFYKNTDGTYSLSPQFSSLQISLSESSDGYCVSYDAYGAKRYYSKLGLPQFFTFKNSGKIEFFYDSSMNLAYISLDGKKTYSFSWSGKNLLSAVECESGKKIEYGYENGILSLIKDTAGDTKKFTYDASGMISRQIKADGSYIGFEFSEIDGKKRCTKTTNEEGKSEYFSYNTAERKMTYTDHDGRISVYVYDEKGRTVSESKPDGTFTNYEYDSENRLTAKTSNSGRISFSYDSDGNMTEKKYSDGTAEKWIYANGLLSSFTDRDGFTQNYFYNSSNLMTDIYRCGRLLYHFEYDSDNKLSSSTGCTGNKTSIKYDSNGNIIEKSVFGEGKSVPARTQKWSYDSENRVSLYTDSLGRKTSYSYTDHSIETVNSDGLVTEEIYSPRKLLLSRTLTDSKTGESRTVYYEYDRNKNCTAQYISGVDSKGRKIEKTKLYSFLYTDSGETSSLTEYDVFSQNQANIVTGFIYSSDGKLNCSKSGFSGSTLKSTYYTRKIENERLITTIKNEEGRLKTQTFDSEGRMLSESENEILKIEREFSPAGRLLRSKNGKSGIIEYSYDESGYLSGTREKNGTLSVFDNTVFLPDGREERYTDRKGNVTKYYYDALDNLIRIENDSGAVERVYDSEGRIISELFKNNSGKTVKSENWDYGEREVVHTLGGKYSKKYVFNAFGEITEVSDENGSKTIFAYDILGRKISEKDAYGNETEFSYNGRGQITKIIFPDKNYLCYEYDSDSNCTSAADRDGLLWKKSYDADGRVKSFSKRPFTLTEYYEYDEFDQIVSVSKNHVSLRKAYTSADGKSGEMTDFLGNKNYFTYDGFGRLLVWKNSSGKSYENYYNSDGSIALIKDFNGNSKKYSYSSDGLSLTVDLSDGESIYYEYDIAGNLIRAKNSSSDLVFTYDEGGMLVSQKNYADGQTIFYAYDSSKNLVKLSGGNREIFYTYGKKGEVLSITENITGESSLLSCGIRFVYDNMGNETLRVFDSGESVKSTYDLSGRLILQLGYDTDLNLVFVDGAVYDENGHKVYSLDSNFQVTSYSYDDYGRLSSVSYPYSESLSVQMKNLVSESGLYFHESAAEFKTLALSNSEYEKIQKLCSGIAFGTFQIPVNETVLTEQFIYDDNDNLIKRVNPYNTIKYSYDSENRLVSWGNDCSADYDENGNMIHKKTAFSEISYEYNGINRIRYVSGKDFISDERFERQNTYDALGRKNYVWQSENGSRSICYAGFSTMIFEIKKNYSAEFTETADVSKSRTTSVSNAYQGRYVYISDDALDTQSRSDSSCYEDCLYEVCPLYSCDGRLVSYFSNGTEAGSSRSVLMSDKAGNVKSEVSGITGTLSYEYEAFGSPVAQNSLFAFSGKIFDAKTGLYDFGFRDYESRNGRFSSIDPVHNGENWYAYCCGNPVEYYDKSGLYEVSTKDYEQHMQDMGHVYLGTSTDSWTDYEGCVVTAIAEALSALGGSEYANSVINSYKECFNGAYINWSAVQSALGLYHEVVFTAGISVAFFAAQAQNPNSSPRFAIQVIQNETAICTVLADIANSSTPTVVIAQVCYDSDKNSSNKNAGLHFVGISTTVTTINGVKAVEITPTSKYDTALTLGNNRSKAGWIIYEGKVYVPLSRINRIDTITKPN